MSAAPQDEIHRGRCACGAVSYVLRGPLRPVVFCHCESCRRQSGHIVSATSVPLDRLSVTGAENLGDWQATPDAVRQFCKVCGSHLFWRGHDATSISVMAGSLDTPTGLTPWGHIFVAEKGDYYEISDGLPQYDGRPPRD
ncbi:GFA family protein [Microbaculum marinisediminis]|uniref:GFA family protein n=1 Tax=Microbaculum marinisediminis TaxID=2931392 RepID=A0AAW5QSE8_9HYPH|nr:GFA family protein [Microbaculum sp. A6E488]MCT8971031.1 GFA family protein [Microbaculum sp. A6E488]